MFDNLSDKLDKAFHILKGHGKITEINVKSTKSHKKLYDVTVPETLNFVLANGLNIRDTSSSGYLQR